MAACVQAGRWCDKARRSVIRQVDQGGWGVRLIMVLMFTRVPRPGMT